MTTDQKAVISRLKDSLELHTIKRDLLIYLVFFGLMYLLSVSDDSGAATLMLLILIPILIFYIWRIICIFRDPEGYIFAECELTQPHCNTFLRSYYFTVRVELPNGQTSHVDTHAIFATHGIFEPIMKDYVNSTVTIAYNPATDMVVVIG